MLNAELDIERCFCCWVANIVQDWRLMKILLDPYYWVATVTLSFISLVARIARFILVGINQYPLVHLLELFIQLFPADENILIVLIGMCSLIFNSSFSSRDHLPNKSIDYELILIAKSMFFLLINSYTKQYIGKTSSNKR